MKKYFLIVSMLSVVGFTSCSSDDNSGNEGQPNVLIGKWVPEKASAVVFGQVMENYTYQYPHTAGCTKDYIQLSENNISNLHRFQGTTCTETTSEYPWSRNGNMLTLNVLGQQITGEIKTETNNILVLESSASEYADIIAQIAPEIPAALLSTAKIRLTLNKN